MRLPFFVYGTLRPGGGNHQLVWPALASVRAAVLDDHGLYAPGALPYVMPAPGLQVRGTLLFIAPDRYDETLARLDRLEGFVPGRAGSNHYERTGCVTRDADGNQVTAWVYLAGHWAATRLRGAAPVSGGDWMAIVHAA